MADGAAKKKDCGGAGGASWCLAAQNHFFQSPQRAHSLCLWPGAEDSRDPRYEGAVREEGTDGAVALD